MKTSRTSTANWAKLFINLDDDVIRSSYHELIRFYNEGHRQYHNLNHINNCLEVFDQVKKLCEDPNAVEIAIWCHDIIYDPTRQDNEEKSAQWIFNILSTAKTPIQNAAHIARLIKATCSHTSYDTDSQILNDIDFSILGAPIAEYHSYSQAIRKEYSHVPDNMYTPARQGVLQKILSRKPIFNTPHFVNMYERSTRRNLENEIRSLESSL